MIDQPGTVLRAGRGVAVANYLAQHRIRLALTALALTTAGLAGCGDGPLCPADVEISIISPAPGSTITHTGPGPSAKTDVVVRTNLIAGDSVDVVITDPNGVETTATTLVDANGEAHFTGIAIPDGVVSIEAIGSSEECGANTDAVAITVFSGDEDCKLSVREGPIANEFYAPLRVLNQSNDNNELVPGFQANIDFQTIAGFEIELFVLDLATAEISSVGTAVAAPNGSAQLAVTLQEGAQQLSARCQSPNGDAVANSGTHPLFVDIQAPTCQLTFPIAGSTIIPSMDEDGGTLDVQLTLRGHVSGGSTDDVKGESTRFTVGTTTLEGSTVSSGGLATVAYATIAEVGTYDLTFSSQDHAGNSCTFMQFNDYVTEGCDVAFLAPTGTITTDGNTNPADGLQATLVMQVGPSCEGKLLYTDCGVTTTSVSVPLGGLVSVPIKVCSAYECEITETCTATVTNNVGITVNVAHTFSVDTLAPPVVLEFLNQGTTCGAVLTTVNDQDPITPGIQIDVRAYSAIAALREVIISNGLGTKSIIAPLSGNVRVTLAEGSNQLVAAAEDNHGNRTETAPCEVGVAKSTATFSKQEGAP